MFSALRSYAGGFHASKESVCTCCTTAALFLSSLSIRWMGRIGDTLIPFCVLVLCGAVVYLLCPLDSEDKPLTNSELVLYRQKSRIIVMAIVLMSIGGICLHIPHVLYAAATGMALEFFLLVLGKVKNITHYHMVDALFFCIFFLQFGM